MKYVLKKALPFSISVVCLVLLSFSLVSAQGAEPAEVGIFEDYEASPGSQIEVPISIRAVEELYAVDITLRFDPEIITIEDANPNQEGVQLALGTFLDAGLVLFNTADNDAGTIRFTMTQVNPSEAKSGEGVLLVLSVQALVEGESQIEVELVELSSRAGEAIPAIGVDSTILVSDDAVAEESTPIPVQDPTAVINVPTPEPTATPSETPEPTPTQTEENSESVDLTQDPQETEVEPPVLEETEYDQPPEQAGEAETAATTDQQSDGFSLLRYWWVVAILVASVLGLGIYLVFTRK